MDAFIQSISITHSHQIRTQYGLSCMSHDIESPNPLTKIMETLTENTVIMDHACSEISKSISTVCCNHLR